MGYRGVTVEQRNVGMPGVHRGIRSAWGDVSRDEPIPWRDVAACSPPLL